MELTKGKASKPGTNPIKILQRKFYATQIFGILNGWKFEKPIKMLEMRKIYAVKSL